jgi:hypothetical protein
MKWVEGSRPLPPRPGAPVPSVPPIETTGPPSATGAFGRLPSTPNPITGKELLAFLFGGLR